MQYRHLHDFNKWHKPFFALLPLATALPHLLSGHHGYRKTPILGSKSNWGPYLRRHCQAKSSFIKSTDRDLFVPGRDYSSIPTQYYMTTIYTDFSEMMDYIFRSDSLRDPFTQKSPKTCFESLNKIQRKCFTSLYQYYSNKCKFTPIFLLFRWTWTRTRNKVLCPVIAQFGRIHELALLE